MMRSLQMKLTLALLLTSLASVALVGLVARGMLQHKFNQIAMDEALSEFRGNLQAYLSLYGSWEKAQQVQPFPLFVRQRQNGAIQTAPTGALGLSTNPTFAPNPSAPASPQAPQPPFQPRNNAGQIGAGQMSPRGQMQGGPPPAPQDEPQEGPPDGPPEEQRQAGDETKTSYRFIVLSPEGKVWLGPPDLRGQDAPAGLRDEAEAVMVGGRTAAFVVPYGEPVYTKQDREYLGAVRQALLRGVFLATLLALAMGLFFGNRLSRRLRELTGAIEAMGEGELRQQVEVHADDEVGVLAGAFNRMSSELAEAHEALQESHAKISRQATMLKELAVRDALTKLHNRRYFDERGAHVFSQAKRYNRPLTVMIGDIDFFKRINDTFSHATGDEVLRHVAQILKKNTRESDIVARYGGEEFVVAFPETELLQALALCERLRREIEAYPWQNIHPDLRVTMSMGLNQDLTLDSFEKMVAGADTRLYSAKESGRNRVCAPVGV